MDSDSDQYDYDSGSDISEDEEVQKCSICLTNQINTLNNINQCVICKENTCNNCIAVISKKSKIGECINCYNKECQECIADITTQIEKYLDSGNDYPLYIEDHYNILNCIECYEKYY